MQAFFFSPTHAFIREFPRRGADLGGIFVGFGVLEQAGRVFPLSVITTKLEIVMRENLRYYENETSTHAMLFDI